jgi:Tol biopolymer transport system component
VGGTGDPNDIWRFHRDSVDSDWGPAEHLPPLVNSAASDFCPTPLNGKRLYFVSTRAGGCGVGAGDIYRTREHPVTGWDAPENLGCAPNGPNFAGGEFSPSLVETDQGTLLFYSSIGPVGTDQDIYVSVMQPDGSFGPGTMVEELSTSANDQMPNVSRDGLEIVFATDRGGTTGVFDIWTASRESTSDAWSGVESVGGNVNLSNASETRPSLSGDGRRLHFGRSGDIWVSTRDVGNAHD